MGTTPTQTPRRGGTFAAGALAVSLLVVVAGCGGSGSDAPMDGKPGGAAAGGAAKEGTPGEGATAGGGAVARMTRQEFRDKLKTLPAAGLGWKNWDGQNREESENVGCPLLVGDLTAAFGEPARKETRGKVIHWDWRCKDGGVRVVASQEWSNKDLFGPESSWPSWPSTITDRPGPSRPGVTPPGRPLFGPDHSPIPAFRRRWRHREARAGSNRTPGVIQWLASC